MKPFPSRDFLIPNSSSENHPGSILFSTQTRENKSRDFLQCRVLLVDDSRENLRILTYQLERIGLIVVVAENGLEAAVRSASEKFDLILMDLQMPVLDGFAATKLLRQLGNQEPILALSALAGSDVLERCLAAGCNGFLQKPIDLEQFVKELGRFFPRRPCDSNTGP